MWCRYGEGLSLTSPTLGRGSSSGARAGARMNRLEGPRESLDLPFTIMIWESGGKGWRENRHPVGQPEPPETCLCTHGRYRPGKELGVAVRVGELRQDLAEPPPLSPMPFPRAMEAPPCPCPGATCPWLVSLSGYIGLGRGGRDGEASRCLSEPGGSGTVTKVSPCWLLYRDTCTEELGGAGPLEHCPELSGDAKFLIPSSSLDLTTRCLYCCCPLCRM